MSFNDTSCSVNGTCVIIANGFTNGTAYVTQYNPNAPVHDGLRKLQLAAICVCNSLSFILIVTRLCYRWSRFKRLRGDDRWVAVAGFFLLGYTASQIATNRYGSGLYMINVPRHWRQMHWQFLPGWAGYYIITTCIKLSVCFCFLDILKNLEPRLNCQIYGLCVLIGSLGVTMTVSWLFPCTPFDSNFVWKINSDYCVNYDIFRGLWIGLSIPIDFAIMAIPFQILRLARLRRHEQQVLKMVFSATLLGTIACAVGIYGAYENRTLNTNEEFRHESEFVITNDVEILMYALGATFPVFSRYLLSRAKNNEVEHNNFSSWARYIPDFLLTNLPHSMREDGTVTIQRSHDTQSYNQGRHLEERPESIFGVPVSPSKSGTSEGAREGEKGDGTSSICKKHSISTTTESVLQEHVETSTMV